MMIRWNTELVNANIGLFRVYDGLGSALTGRYNYECLSVANKLSTTSTL
jgi:hypothetical protein